MPTFTDVISPSRFSTYRLWADQDEVLAKRLYTFNVQLSAALYGPLHMLEVALRNVTDRQLAVKRGVDWLDDAQVLTTRYQSDCVTKARENLARNGKPGTHGQMVAELNFGFWARYSAGAATISGKTCGRFFKHAAFSATASPSNLMISALRNRVAHYEPILALPLAQRYADITTLTGWLSPSAAAWINENSEWLAVYPGVPILVTDPATNQTRVSPGVLEFLPG